jgi:hypothetical protein
MAKKGKFDLEALDLAASGSAGVARETKDAPKPKRRSNKKQKTIKVQVLFDDDEIELLERAKDVANISATSAFCRKAVLDAAKALVG